MSDDDHAAAAFLAAVDRLVHLASPDISTTAAATLLAIHLGLATDSRSIAKRLGLAHALVLREIAAASPRYIRTVKRDSRTQRTWLELTDDGRDLAQSSVST